MKPVNDKFKIRISTDEYGFGNSSAGVEKGVVVEVPDKLLYFGFHSFAFENSIANPEVLKEVLDYYAGFKGKLVVWESLQDRGRRFKEDGSEFVYLNMSDIICFSDDVDINIEIVDQVGAAGSFNLS